MLVLVAGALACTLVALLAAAGGGTRPQEALPVPQPLVADYAQITASDTPPTEAQCFSAGRRCFTPQSVRAAYNVPPLHAAGLDGRGRTIAIVDSFGSDTMAHDLHVFDNAFALQPMCGEESVTCAPGMPKFSRLALQGSPATKAPPGQSKGPGQQDRSAWALEVALDVETAHAMAPGANILLVTTPTAETLGVQGFPQMMAAEQYVVDHHLADVISQSFGSAEEAFGSANALENLRHAFKSAAASGVTVLASSGDTGSANGRKTPVGQGGSTIPGQTVIWPGSDPLVTGVGGTALCTDPAATSARVVDSADPPAACQATLPAGSTPVPTAARGVPDIGLQASPRTGALVYVSLPPDGAGGLQCAGTPCSTGWYDIGGTSLAAPEWSGLVAIAAQIKGHGLGQINPALYRLASDPATYARDFFDVTVGNNQPEPDIPGFPASTGWDPDTGLGTPNAAALLPDLAAAAG